MLIYNDLGGIRNKENKVIKKNMVIRAASLNKIGKIDILKLKKHNLSKVIDLRTSVELEEKPDVKIEGVKYIHVPIFKEKTVGITHEIENNKIEVLKNMPNMQELYSTMVTDEYSVMQLKNTINEIVNSDNFSVLFHCTAGKDRTGVVAMLILSILNVDINEIIKNYLQINKTQKLKGNILYLLIKRITKDTELALKGRNLCVVDKEYLMAAIKSIEDKYGNMDNFIKNQLGITDEMKEQFKKKVLN